MALDPESFALLKAAVERFVMQRLVPAENELEVTDEVPADIVADMKAMGLFGLSVPEKYGGIGLSMAQECEVARELGRTALAFRSMVGTNVGIGSQGILMDGTEEQKEEYLSAIASGDLIISFALTEPGAGSDAASIRTRAELLGGTMSSTAPSDSSRTPAAPVRSRSWRGRGATARPVSRRSSCRPTRPVLRSESPR
jgi:acyl-CoA dehydrogenase